MNEGDDALTRKELLRRRQLAMQQLLNVYRREYVRELTTLASNCEALVQLPETTELTDSQQNVLNARFEEFAKSRVEVQELDGNEVTELEGFGIPVVCGESVAMKEGGLSFSQAEDFVSRQLSVALNSSRLEPHLSTASALEEPRRSTEKKEVEKRDEWDEEKKADLKRLEAIACSASFREMDREDFLIALLAPRGKFSIRRTAFVIGCTPQLKLEPEKQQSKQGNPLALDSSSHIGRKRKADGELGKGRGLMKIDVDLSSEGLVCEEVQVAARVWLRADGAICIESTGVQEIKIDRTQMTSDEPSTLGQMSMLEIGGVPLLVLINQNAINRVQKRSAIEINI